MGQISLNLPQVGGTNAAQEPLIPGDFSTIQTVINGNLDSTNLAATAAQSAGVNQSGQTVKGSSIIATSQNTGSTTYTTLSTPDQVTGIVLPTPGLLEIWYQASWSETVNAAAHAAIFIGASQLKIAGATVPVVQEATMAPGNASNAVPLATTGTGGLLSVAPPANYSGDVTTGQVIGSGLTASGGPVHVFAAAGTYTVSVQFKASSGTVSASGRRLYVMALSFA